MSKLPAKDSRGGNVFDRPLHLAGILDNAADDLQQTWFGYDWNDRTRCNCGFVARQVMKISATSLKQLLPPIYEDGAFRPSWSAMSETYCTETGLSRNRVFTRLLAAGMHVSDFPHLEDLSHPAVLERAGRLRLRTKPVKRSRKADVIAYLRGWAWGIEDHHDAEAPAPVRSGRV